MLEKSLKVVSSAHGSEYQGLDYPPTHVPSAHKHRDGILVFVSSKSVPDKLNQLTEVFSSLRGEEGGCHKDLLSYTKWATKIYKVIFQTLV